jgi:ABC-2 type transport system permease protein
MTKQGRQLARQDAGKPVHGLGRLQDELAQAWAIAVKDMRVYYLTPPMIMFGLMLPFFLFFSFSIKREIGPDVGTARLLALTTFFTASSAGPVIIPLERRMGTYDRLLAAPMSLLTLLLGKTLVGAFFGLAVSAVPLLVGVLWLHVTIANAGFLLLGLALASLAFSAFGLTFASIPTKSVGNIMMPSTMIRWPLLFISGIFIPVQEMAPWARALAHLSPLTYAQDLMNHAVLGEGLFNPWLDLVVLSAMSILLLWPSVKMHQRSRKLGY